jgi:peptidyl-prolyl cis-trans isomerase A (cyclophilin A)
MKTIACMLAAVLGAGCSTKKSSDGGGEAKPSGGGGTAAGGQRSEGEPALKVRPPTASDLAKYTEGLSGSGPLMARFDTSMGEINCELFEKGAPVTVANCVGLARGLHAWRHPRTGEVEQAPFYDGLIFHRVIPQFMIQGGDPLGQGSGGPGYQFATEVSDALKHDAPGILSMANAGPNTNGSQFFITEGPTPSLDGGYNVFGKCAEVDVVKQIARVPVQGERPVDNVVMKRVEIYRK